MDRVIGCYWRRAAVCSWYIKLLSVLFGILNYGLFFFYMVVVPCCLSLSHDLYEFTCLGFKVQNSGLSGTNVQPPKYQCVEIVICILCLVDILMVRSHSTILYPHQLTSNLAEIRPAQSPLAAAVISQHHHS